MAGGPIDDQSWDFAVADRGQLCGDDLDVPVHRELGLRVELQSPPPLGTGAIHIDNITRM